MLPRTNHPARPVCSLLATRKMASRGCAQRALPARNRQPHSPGGARAPLCPPALPQAQRAQHTSMRQASRCTARLSRSRKLPATEMAGAVVAAAATQPGGTTSVSPARRSTRTVPSQCCGRNTCCRGRRRGVVWGRGRDSLVCLAASHYTAHGTPRRLAGPLWPQALHAQRWPSPSQAQPSQPTHTASARSAAHRRVARAGGPGCVGGQVAGRGRAERKRLGAADKVAPKPRAAARHPKVGVRSRRAHDQVCRGVGAVGRVGRPHLLQQVGGAHRGGRMDLCLRGGADKRAELVAEKPPGLRVVSPGLSLKCLACV